MQFVSSRPPFTPRSEEDAVELAASVYRDIRTRMPFVPAIFRALAADPGALAPAWLQARALYDDPRSRESAARLRELARARVDYRPSAAVRAAVAPFAAELPSMLLIVASLGLALDGALELRPLPPLALPEPGPVPEPRVPELQDEHLLFDEIRAVYGLAHVPSVFRALAAQRLLEEPWRAIGPFLAAAEGRELVARVAAAAEEEALRFPEAAFFGAARARPVLDQFRRALPANLVFVTAASG